MARCRAVTAGLCGILLLTSLPTRSAQAAMVITPDLVHSPAAGSTVAGAVDRDLVARLQALGVELDSAQQRVAALSPQERARLLEQFEQWPAGGEIIGTIVFAALVLLLTDILGYTDVYPFVTRTVNGEKQTHSNLERCVPIATAAVTP